jgi:hypothetical protein
VRGRIDTQAVTGEREETVNGTGTVEVRGATRGGTTMIDHLAETGTSLMTVAVAVEGAETGAIGTVMEDRASQIGREAHRLHPRNASLHRT